MADLASPRFLTASVSIPKNLRRNDRHRGYHTRSGGMGLYPNSTCSLVGCQLGSEPRGSLGCCRVLAAFL